MSLALIFTAIVLVAIGSHPSDGGAVAEFQPEFAQPLENVTVPLGRDATFTCVVKDLGGYRVGWVRADSKAIQAIHTHVITHNPRISVSHSDHSTWHLHIKGVKEEDRGSFMCQVNTDPMMSQVSYLEVVIPPDFIPEETSGDLMAPEGSTVKLTCNARGHPNPSIVWKRENGLNITLKSSVGGKTHVSVFEGNVLRLPKVSRADMGPYFCIASNGVPPSISKRIILSVHFHPVIHVPNQLVGAPVNTDIILECNVEAYPRSIHFWIKDSGGMIITGDRYEVQETTKSMFEVKMVLIIRRFQPEDTGRYSCIAKNSIGDVESIIKLHELKILEDPSSGRIKLPNSLYEEEDYEDNFVENRNLDGGAGSSGGRRESGTFNPLESRNTTRGYDRNNPSNRQQFKNRKPTHHTTASAGNKATAKHPPYNTIIVRTDEAGNGLEGSSNGAQCSKQKMTTTRIIWGLLLLAINYHYSIPLLHSIPSRRFHFK